MSKETLEFYRVGKRIEKFRQLDGTYSYEECMVFPIYAKRMSQKPFNSTNNPTPETIINHNSQFECIKLKYR